MCLILLAYQNHPDYPLILAANRDEFYTRPTAAAHFWDEHPKLLAGRDLQAGGSWMGVTRQGRFAAITNVREPEKPDQQLRSRGELTINFLKGKNSARDYLSDINEQHHQYAGFNLLAGQLDDLWFYSNRDHSIQALEPGIYGISNGGFDEHWPKVAKGKVGLEHAIQHYRKPQDLLALLQDQQIALDQQLPNTGVDLAIERWLSPLFIHNQDFAYGTRCSTIMTLSHDGALHFFEQSYDHQALPSEHREYRFSVLS